MPGEESYQRTTRNNKTEAEGVALLLSSFPEIYRPDAAGREKILQALGLGREFRRAFDAVRVEGANSGHEEAALANPAAITLIEIKTTKKKLPHNPYGFFFGATENEFKLAGKLGDRYRFAFICLHPEMHSSKLLTLQETENLISSKRVQFQISLVRR
jgi:hypothetical protein